MHFSMIFVVNDPDLITCSTEPINTANQAHNGTRAASLTPSQDNTGTDLLKSW